MMTLADIWLNYFLFPLGMILLTFFILHLLMFPAIVCDALRFRIAETGLDKFMCGLVWVEALGAMFTAIVLVVMMAYL